MNRLIVIGFNYDNCKGFDDKKTLFPTVPTFKFPIIPTFKFPAVQPSKFYISLRLRLIIFYLLFTLLIVFHMMGLSIQL